MKKLLFVLMFLPMISFSQIKLGVHGGVSMVNIQARNVPENLESTFAYKFKPSYFFGADLIYPFGDKAGLLLGIEYNVKGNNFKGVASSQALTYIQFPFLLQIKPSESFGINFGPKIGVLIKQVFQNQNGKFQNNLYGNFDMGLAAGFTVFLTEEFTFSMQYEYGIYNIQRFSQYFDINGLPVTTMKFNNQFAGVSVGYIFPEK